MPYKNLQNLMKSRNISQSALARILQRDRAVVTNMFQGRRRLSTDEAKKIALTYGVSLAYILDEEEERKIPVIGEVGAGSEVFPFDDFPLIRRPERLAEHVHPADGLDYVDAPPGVGGRDIVALRVRGDSMLPMLEDGDIIYYSQRIEANFDDMIGQRVVVKIKNGPTLVKRLKRGRSYGRYDLISHNASIMEDKEIEWCAKVLFIRPV